MKANLLLLLLVALIGFSACSSDDVHPRSRRALDTQNGPAAMPGSDSNASDNRY